MKVLMILLAGLLAMVLWLRHDNVNLSRSLRKRAALPASKDDDWHAEKSACRIAANRKCE
ncbi:hypothetical protein K7G95_13310 [Escherichia coli]|nr:hypothetical protein K7G95_13310 [Escherichia coli]